MIKITILIIATLILGGLAYSGVEKEKNTEIGSKTKEDKVAFYNPLQVTTTSIQDPKGTPPTGYGSERFAPGHGMVIIAKVASAPDKVLTLHEVNEWIHRETEIEADFEYFYNVALSPDKTKVAFSFHGVAWDYLGIWEVATNMLRYVSHGDLGYGNLTWSPDGKYIAYISGAIFGVNVIDIQRKERIFKDLPNGTQVFQNTDSPQWSSDSRQLFFRKYVGEKRSSTGSLWVVDIDNIDPRQVQ